MSNEDDKLSMADRSAKPKMTFGIVVYADSSLYQQTLFDGWYDSRELADEAFQALLEKYPTATVHLVERLASESRSKVEGAA